MYYKMTTRLLIMVLFFCVVAKGTAQYAPEEDFSYYSRKEGLSSDEINDVTQDAFGYLWVGTRKGLNRFDGSSFQQFYSDGNPNSLQADHILRFKWIDKEQLGMSVVGGGFHIVNTRTLQSRNIIVPADSIKKLNKQYRVNDALAHDGNIFILTGVGFYHFNSGDELLFRYDHYPADYLKIKPARFGHSIVKIDNHNLLLSTHLDGLFIYNIKQKDLRPVSKSNDGFYQQINPEKKRLHFIYNDDTSFALIKVDENEIWWCDISKKTKRVIKCPVSAYINFDFRSKLVPLNDSVFTLNSVANGFYFLRYERLRDSLIFDPQRYFSDNSCQSLFLDKKHRLWIATNQGLFHEKRSSARIEEITTPFQTRSHASHIKTMVLANDKLFAGTNNEGLLVIDRDSLKTLKRIDFSTYGTDSVIYPNIVNSLIEAATDTFYVGVTGLWLNARNLSHGRLMLPRIGAGPHTVDILFKDSRGNIYLKKANKNIYYYRTANERKYSILDYDSVLSSLWIGSAVNMSEDRVGNIWFIGNGMKRFNYRLQKFDLSLDSFLTNRIGNKYISSNLVFDNEGQIYFGVGDKGLVIYDPARQTFSQHTRNNGLPDNTIANLLLQNNKLWIATESGLANYDLGTKKITAFGTSDGIPIDGSVMYSLLYDSANHQLYGAFKNTIFRFDPETLTKNDAPPDFFIDNIHIRGKDPIYHPAGEITLSHKYNNLVINLGAVNFEDAYTQLFAYRFVKTGNEAWEEIGSQRSIILSNLTPGEHKLHVKVYVRNQSWPEQVKEISIMIRPPFWKTPWFILFSLTLLLTVLYVIYRYRIKRIQQHAKIDKQITELELKGLHAQMNPHFIFNCLNSIREMILNNENQQASHYLSKFAQLIRITLTQSSKQFITLDNTIDYLERYVEMEEIRNNKFSCTIDVDEQLQTDEIMIPPMLIQPFLENAIWHGAIPGKELQIRIRFKKEGNRIVCFVEDNGQGIEASMNNKKEMQASHNSIGIANVKERIQVLNEKYKLNSELSIEDKSKNGNETGTIVKLYFPLQSIAS